MITMGYENLITSIKIEINPARPVLLDSWTVSNKASLGNEIKNPQTTHKMQK